MRAKGCPFCGSTKNIIMKAIRNGVKKGESVETRWVQCCDCGARGSERGTKQKAVEAWETRQDAWIPAILETPERTVETSNQSELVLISTRLGMVAVGFYDYSEGKWSFEGSRPIMDINDVVCWMPLPVPPAEKLRW